MLGPSLRMQLKLRVPPWGWGFPFRQSCFIFMVDFQENFIHNQVKLTNQTPLCKQEILDFKISFIFLAV